MLKENLEKIERIKKVIEQAQLDTELDDSEAEGESIFDPIACQDCKNYHFCKKDNKIDKLIDELT